MNLQLLQIIHSNGNLVPRYINTRLVNTIRQPIHAQGGNAIIYMTKTADQTGYAILETIENVSTLFPTSFVAALIHDFHGTDGTEGKPVYFNPEQVETVSCGDKHLRIKFIDGSELCILPHLMFPPF